MSLQKTHDNCSLVVVLLFVYVSEGDSMDGLKPGFFIGDGPEEDHVPTEMPVTDPGQFNPGFTGDAIEDETDLERKGSSKVSFHLGNFSCL